MVWRRTTSFVCNVGSSYQTGVLCETACFEAVCQKVADKVRRLSRQRANVAADPKSSRPDQKAQPAGQLSQAGFPLSKSSSLGQSSGVSRVPSGTSLASLASIHENDSIDFDMLPTWDTDQALSTNTRASRSQSLTTKLTSSPAKEKRRLECPYCCKVYSVGGHFQNHLRDHRELRPWQQVLLDPPSQRELFQAPSRIMSRNISQTSIASMGQPSSLHDVPQYPTGAGTPGEQSIFFVDEDNPHHFQDADMQMQLVDDVDEPPFFLTPTMKLVKGPCRDDESLPAAFYAQSYGE